MTLGTQYNRENMPPSPLTAEPGSPRDFPGEVDALPRKAGPVTMHQALPGSSKKIKVPVILKVYATSYGRYAVVAQDRLPLCKDCGYIKLRNCTVRPLVSSPLPVGSPPRGLRLRQSQNQQVNQPGFEIIAKRGEGESLQFTVKDSAELNEWISVLDPDSEVCKLRASSEPIPIVSSHTDMKRRSRSLGSPKSAPAMPCLSEDDEEEPEE